jgi:hypothetical protein
MNWEAAECLSGKFEAVALISEGAESGAVVGMRCGLWGG